VAPQRQWLPPDIGDDPIKLGHWFFFMSLPMRVGINSDDAFRFMYELYLDNPDLFNPYTVMKISPKDVLAVVKKVARRIHPGGSQGDKKEGTFSYQSNQHSNIWVDNSARLVNFWGGDIRNVFWGITEFEEAFRRIDHERNPVGFRGMRRKIFSLLTMWLQEFALIHKFPLPLIVDFHAIRLLLQLRILAVEYKPLGPGNSKREERMRPQSMWHYLAIRITEKIVDEVIIWSQRFLMQHGLDPYDVGHGVWFLSRELCKNYYGNRSIERRLGKRRTVTERLITDEELKSLSSWPANYRDPCQFCHVENMCKIRIPAGPYFDWGVMVNAGKHVTFPGRSEALSVITRDMPVSFRRNGKRTSVSEPKSEIDDSLQGNLIF